MATYTSPSQSGYNSSPPADDGTETTANRVDWDTIKTKLSDPNKDYAEAIDSAVTAAFTTVDSDMLKTFALYASADVTWASREIALKTTGLTVSNVAVGTYKVETYQSMIDGSTTGGGDDGIKSSLIFTGASSMGGVMAISVLSSQVDTNIREFDDVHIFSFDATTDLSGITSDAGITTVGIVNVTNASNSIDLHTAQVSATGTVGMKQTDAYMILTRLS